MARPSFAAARLRILLGLAGVSVLASCGGSDGGTAPGTVTRVDVTAPSVTIEVGQSVQLTARYFNASNTLLSGKQVNWTSGNASVATVSVAGVVTALAPGSVTVTATVTGVAGTISITVNQVPVFFVAISPASPTVREGQTVTLSAQPSNAVGQALAGRAVTWSSANPARATVTQDGVVSGLAPGMVYIRASSEGKTDSVNLRVRSLIAPVITGTSAGELTPGASGTLTGTNFGDDVSENEVFVNGARATVTAGSAGSVTFTVPPRADLPCTGTGPAQVLLVARGDSAVATMNLRVATQRTLAVGASALLTTAEDLLCNEFAGNGGRYIITAFNYAPSADIRTSFRLTGTAPVSVPSVAAAASPSAAAPNLALQSPPARGLSNDPFTRHLAAHASFMRQDRELARQLGRPRLAQRRQGRLRSGAASISPAIVAPPAVGEYRTLRMRRTLNSVSQYDEVSFRVVYSGSKMVIMEDVTSPLAASMDAEFVRLGEEFDNVMYDQLKAFGDPLVVDSALDNNGRLLAIFSPRVNNYTINGVSNQILGFVSLCDFFPRTPITLPDNTVIPACPASNEAEAFYALVPNPAEGWSISLWRRLIRGTLIHEAKHIASYAWRYYFDASELEDVWLEEATAQVASELWARSIYGRQARQDLGWLDGPQCDYAPAGGACPDPAEGILHHFGFLYDHYKSSESKSILDGTDQVIYGSSWSFVRYVTDAFATSEPGFLSSLVKVQNDHGVSNVESKSGRSFAELFGSFSLASAADNYPGAQVVDPRLKLESWNSRDLFDNMSRFITTGGGASPFPLAWPLTVRQLAFGTIPPGAGDVTQLRGGSFVAWELSGTQVGAQALAIRSSTGGAAPVQVGLGIVRIQ